MMWLILAWLFSVVLILLFLSMAHLADVGSMDAMSDVEFFEHVDERGEFHLDPFHMSDEPYPDITTD